MPTIIFFDWIKDIFLFLKKGFLSKKQRTFFDIIYWSSHLYRFMLNQKQVVSIKQGLKLNNSLELSFNILQMSTMEVNEVIKKRACIQYQILMMML